MKNIYLISLVCLLSFSVSAQVTLKTKPQTEITNTSWSFNVSLGLADTVGVRQDSVSIPLYVNSVDSLKEEIKLVLTEVVSPARTIVQYQARRSDTDTWTTLSSFLYTGAGTDTTIRIRNVLYKAWPYKRVMLITNSAENKKAYPSKLSGFFKK